MAKDPTLTQVRITGCIGSSIAIVVTLFRLSIRIRRKTVWWDDFWAGLAMIGIVIFMTGILIFTDNPHRHSRSVKVAGYYMVDNGFYAVIWCSRASLFLTLVRLSFGRFRTFLKYCVAAVIVTYAVLFAQVFWTCEGEPGWKDQVVAQCMLGRKVAIAQLITDCAFDSALIASPIYLLSGMKHRRGLKIRLIAVFSATIFTTAFSLAHAWAIIEDRGLMEFMLAALEVFVSLIVVNLTVIVSWFLKINDENTDERNIMNTFIKGRLSKSSGRRDNSLGTQHHSYNLRRTGNISYTNLVTIPPKPEQIHIEVTTDKHYSEARAGSPLSFLPVVLKNGKEGGDEDVNENGKVPGV